MEPISRTYTRMRKLHHPENSLYCNRIITCFYVQLIVQAVMMLQRLWLLQIEMACILYVSCTCKTKRNFYCVKQKSPQQAMKIQVWVYSWRMLRNVYCNWICFHFNNFGLFFKDMAYFDNPENETGVICSRLATEVSSIQGVSFYCFILGTSIQGKNLSKHI